MTKSMTGRTPSTTDDSGGTAQPATTTSPATTSPARTDTSSSHQPPRPSKPSHVTATPRPETVRTPPADPHAVRLGGSVWSVEVTIDSTTADAVAARALVRRLRLQRTFTDSSATAMPGRVLLRARVPAATAAQARERSAETLDAILSPGWIVLELHAHRTCN